MSVIGATEYPKKLSGAKLKELHRESLGEIKECRSSLKKITLFLKLRESIIKVAKRLLVVSCLIMLSASTALTAPDISVEKTASPDPVTAGSNLTYTIIIQNEGPDTATGVTLEDNLPAGVSFVSAKASVGACFELNGVVTCLLGNFILGRGETVLINVTAPNTAGNITNTVIVSENETDLDISNNIDTIETTVNPAPLCAAEVIYGENSGKVEILKSFRDEVLSKSPEGQEIIRLYYKLSPVVVKAMEEDEEFKEEVRGMIDGVLLLITEEAG